MSGKQPPTLKKLETRLPSPMAAKLQKLARLNARSVAAEIRVAVTRHLEDAA